jgi:hypothetical protein
MSPSYRLVRQAVALVTCHGFLSLFPTLLLLTTVLGLVLAGGTGSCSSGCWTLRRSSPR